MTSKTTINQEEVEKFSKMADEWWDPEGKFKPLHKINPVRLKYLREAICTHFKIKDDESPLKNLSILDIGCGGGLVSIPLARLGAKLTAIDASEKNLRVAAISAQKFGAEVDFQHKAVEELQSGPFDVILALEVIEHIDNVSLFIENIARLLKGNGILVLSTINRTINAYLKAIIGAEYILRWLPIGTHEFKKFLKPSEIVAHLDSNNLKLCEMKGLVFNPLSWEWSLSDDIDVNYFMLVEKKLK
ncbi:MAG: ubiG [Rickettsiaceae bacterium]|jgi:2-polyprenyl-6-hydroxyphenyl methylase/3-demethylubiquinone-9 3-methyltransferase|nr:ubiG [Rickettsiaceae bacterium]